MRRTARYDDETSDETLLAGVAAGDDGAVLAFVRRYQRRIYGLALGIVRDPGTAEDVARAAKAVCVARADREAPPCRTRN